MIPASVRLLGAVCALALIGVAATRRVEAEGVTPVFAAPSQAFAAGTPVTLTLLCVNDSSVPVQYSIAPEIPCQVIPVSGGAPVEAALRTPADAATSVAIAANSFSKVAYVLELAPSFAGTALLDIPNYNRLKLTVSAGATSIAPQTAPPAPPPPTTPADSASVAKASAPAPSPYFGSFLATHVTPYEPIFFLIGTHPSVEFQFSLKVQLLDWAVSEHPWDQIFLGYTQTSFWDLINKDPSFYDTSYKPSVFYAARVLTINTTPKPLTLSHQLGFEHESNGDGGINERSQNTVYYQPLLTYGERGGWVFALQPRFWYYATIGDNNKDLAAYRGYGYLRAALTWKNYQLATKFEVGSAGKHPAYEVDLMTTELRRIMHLDPAFQIQYFDGYGQNLRDYDKIDHGVRAGFSLWYPGIDSR